MKASEVIEEARDLHRAFDDNAHPDGIVLRFLSRYQRELMGTALTRYPSLYNETQDVTLPLTDFAAGIALDNPFYLEDLIGTEAGGRVYPVPILPYEHRFDAVPSLFAYVTNRVLYLGRSEDIWGSFATLQLRYATTTPDLADEDALFALPDNAKSALVQALGQFMSGRGTQRGDIAPPDVSYYTGLHEQAKETFLTQLWLLRSSEARFIRDVS